MPWDPAIGQPAGQSGQLPLERDLWGWSWQRCQGQRQPAGNISASGLRGLSGRGKEGQACRRLCPSMLVCQVLEGLGFGANSAGHPHLRLSHGGGRGPIGSPKTNLQKALFSFQK